MSKHRKKPIVIEAIEWTGKNHREVFDFLEGQDVAEDYIRAEGKNFLIDHSRVIGGLIIKTLEGDMFAGIGWYIIKGIKGEFYPCEGNIFKETYDSVEASDEI